MRRRASLCFSHGLWGIALGFAFVPPLRADPLIVPPGSTVPLGTDESPTTTTYDSLLIESGGTLDLQGDMTLVVEGDIIIHGTISRTPKDKAPAGNDGMDGAAGLDNQPTGQNVGLSGQFPGTAPGWTTRAAPRLTLRAGGNVLITGTIRLEPAYDGGDGGRGGHGGRGGSGISAGPGAQGGGGDAGPGDNNAKRGGNGGAAGGPSGPGGFTGGSGGPGGFGGQVQIEAPAWSFFGIVHREGGKGGPGVPAGRTRGGAAGSPGGVAGMDSPAYPDGQDGADGREGRVLFAWIPVTDPDILNRGFQELRVCLLSPSAPAMAQIANLEWRPAPAAPPPVVSIRLVAGQSPLEFSWPSVAGHSCQIQTRLSLTSGDWANFGAPLTGTGETLTATATIPAGQPEAFYRVVVSGSP